MDDTLADENTTHIITEYLCGCCQTVAKERRVSRVERPPVATMRGDYKYGAGDTFSQKSGASEPPCV